MQGQNYNSSLVVFEYFAHP